MKTATLANAKPHLSALIADVEAGEDVIVTRRGKPFARLVPEARSRNFDSADLRDSVSVPPTPGRAVAETQEQDLL